VSKIIVCCFVLHNVAKYLKDPDDFAELPPQPEDAAADNNNNSHAQDDFSDARIRNLGQQKRKNLMEILFRNRNN
jgi:hypothetical protein